MFTLFDKDGNACVVNYSVDKKEMLDSGNYFEKKPEIKELEPIKKNKNSKKEEAKQA